MQSVLIKKIQLENFRNLSNEIIEFSDKINCIFIDDSMAKALSSIQQITRGRKIPSLTFSETFVRQGISIGIIGNKNKPKLIVNRKASVVEGINFDANIFRTAKVVSK